jgi:hypothetical protein
MREYTEVLSLVVDAISKLSPDDEISDTSTTLPETVVTNTQEDSSFSLFGGSLEHQVDGTKNYAWIEDETQTDPFWERRIGAGGSDADAESDDDTLSISSDVVPLAMTDEDALDEISFTRELMGYVEGFEAHEIPVWRIEEEEDEEYESFAREQRTTVTMAPKTRPPLPTLSRQSVKREAPKNTANKGKKLQKGHRRNNSGGSAPTILQSLVVREEGMRQHRQGKRPADHVSLPGNQRSIVPCSNCGRRIRDGDVCQCGKWEI